MTTVRGYRFRQLVSRTAAEDRATHVMASFNGKQRAARESEIQHQIVELLRRAGWYVRVFSAHKRMPKQLEGMSDVLAVKHGVVLFIETKNASGNLRPGQVEFQAAMCEHGGANVRHLVARSVEDVLAVIGEVNR